MRSASSLLALLLAFIAAAPLRAADDIHVLSASATLHGDALHFTARSEFPADEQMRAALAAGAIVDLGLQVIIERKSRYWMDEELVDESLRRELTWNAPSQRFVLRDAGSTRQQTFATLEEALAVAGLVDNWPVKLGRKLDPDETYEVSVRARLRRGRMPSALRALTFWTRYWSRSEWHSWVLAR